MAQLHVVHLFFAFAAVLSALCSGVGIVYTVSASFLMRRFFSRPTNAPVCFPAVTIIKPLHGDEWQLLENLTSFVEQDYPGPVQYVFGVHDRADAALVAVDVVRARFPEKNITVVVDGRLYGPNRKDRQSYEHAGSRGARCTLLRRQRRSCKPRLPARHRRRASATRRRVW